MGGAARLLGLSFRALDACTNIRPQWSEDCMHSLLRASVRRGATAVLLSHMPPRTMIVRYNYVSGPHSMPSKVESHPGYLAHEDKMHVRLDQENTVSLKAVNLRRPPLKCGDQAEVHSLTSDAGRGINGKQCHIVRRH